MSITEFAVKRPVAIAVVFGLLSLLGVYSFLNTDFQLTPDISMPTITITTVYPGASPQVVEDSVTKPIEEAVASVDGLDYVSSKSLENASIVTMHLLPGSDSDKALEKAQREINSIQDRFPSEVKTPTLSPLSTSDLPILKMVFTSDLPSGDFYSFIDGSVRPRLAKVPGVGLVTIIGGNERTIKVNLNQDELNRYGISSLQVLNALKAANRDWPAGTIKDEDGQFDVEVSGKFCRSTRSASW